MVIRLISIPDHLDLPEFHEVIQAVLGWTGDLGYIVRVHGQEYNGFRRRSRTKTLGELRLHRQERFYYACDLMHMWEWDIRFLDIQDGLPGDYGTMCLGGTPLRRNTAVARPGTG